MCDNGTHTSGQNDLVSAKLHVVYFGIPTLSTQQQSPGGISSPSPTKVQHEAASDLTVKNTGVKKKIKRCQKL